MARGRKKLTVSKKALQLIVDELESDSVFPNRTELYKAIEETEWANGLLPRPLTSQVAYLRCRELGIKFKTPAKRRVRVKKIVRPVQTPVKSPVVVELQKNFRPSMDAPAITLVEQSTIAEATNQDNLTPLLHVIPLLGKTEAGRQRIIKVISTATEDNWQNVHTPYDICNEMCELVPDATHFVVLFSLEFLEILVKRGINPQNIIFFADNKLEADIARHPKIYGVQALILDKNKIVQGGVFCKKALSIIIKDGIKNMKFTKLAVIMNPPYQQEDGGHSRSAKPIYHLFIETIVDDLSPDYLVSINPSRWMIGGKGLNKFRRRMMHDRRIKKIVHFPGSFTVFPGVKIANGVNYWLWDANHNGQCNFNGVDRFLDQYDIIIQDNNAIPILEKVKTKCSKWMSDLVVSRKPFGLGTNFRDWRKDGVPCCGSGGRYFVSPNAFTDKHKILDKWKVAIGEAFGEAGEELFRVIGDPFIIEPGAICTETYIVVNAFDSKRETENFVTYMRTKFFRFLLLLRKPTQHINKQKFAFVPDLEDYSAPWADKELYKKFGLTRQEIAYIESKIKELK